MTIMSRVGLIESFPADFSPTTVSLSMWTKGCYHAFKQPRIDSIWSNGQLNWTD